MKKKLLLALIACMLLSGCGQSVGKEQGVTGNDQETKESRTMEESENPMAREEATAGSEQESETTGNTMETGEGEVKKLGESEGKEIDPVKLDNAYQRAAFLADQVYEVNWENTLVSPLSLEMALGLATEGASGETAKELYKYLGNENYADWVEQYLDFAKSLESTEETQEKGDDGTEYVMFSPKYSFRYEMANSLWVRKEDKLSEEYRKLVEKKFKAVAENVDFVNQSAETADRINSWCDEHTHGMIKKIVQPEMFNAELAAVLVNSVYFESPWTDKWGLTEHEFTNVKGETTTQEMLSDTVHAYYENEYCTAFSKNYFNGFQFIGILPKKEGDFRISELDLKSLLDSKTYDYDVRAIAPKLDFETTANNIVDILKAQGVQKAFDKEFAEFDRLLEGRELHIDDIIQKCKIEMDEEGTRAAAVTAMMMATNSAVFEEPKFKEVYLDRPFAFLIYDSQNDQIVFVGKVTEL